MTKTYTHHHYLHNKQGMRHICILCPWYFFFFFLINRSSRGGYGLEMCCDTSRAHHTTNRSAQHASDACRAFNLVEKRLFLFLVLVMVFFFYLQILSSQLPCNSRIGPTAPAPTQTGSGRGRRLQGIENTIPPRCIKMCWQQHQQQWHQQGLQMCCVLSPWYVFFFCVFFFSFFFSFLFY